MLRSRIGQYRAVTLAKMRQVPAVVIKECKISQRQTIKANRKPINVDEYAFTFVCRESLKAKPMGIEIRSKQT